MQDALSAEIPSEWLKKLADKYLTEEEKKQIEAMGGLDKLLETLKKRMAEQKGRTRAAANGSAPAAHRLLVIPATTPRACASARTATRTSAR